MFPLAVLVPACVPRAAVEKKKKGGKNADVVSDCSSPSLLGQMEHLV